MANATYQQPRKTDVAVALYPSLETPNTKFDAKNDKLEVTLLFDVGADMSAIDEAVAEAVESEWPDGAPADVIGPVKSNLERDGAAFGRPGTHVKLKTKKRPQIINASGEPIDVKEIYSGCKVKALFTAKGWHIKGKNGGCYVSLYLRGLLKVADGDRIGGGPTVAEAFADDLDDDIL